MQPTESHAICSIFCSWRHYPSFVTCYRTAVRTSLQVPTGMSSSSPPQPTTAFGQNGSDDVKEFPTTHTSTSNATTAVLSDADGLQRTNILALFGGSQPHTLEAERILKVFSSDPKYGLSQEAAAAGLEKYGPNRLKPPKRPSLLKIFLRQVANAMTVSGTPSSTMIDLC
jgi:magnesium-transporting ATPase (P-type)